MMKRRWQRTRSDDAALRAAMRRIHRLRVGDVFRSQSVRELPMCGCSTALRTRAGSRATARSTKTFGLEGVGRAPKLNGLNMRPPDFLRLLQLVSPRNEFCDDVIDGLHLLYDPRFDAVTLTNAGASYRQTLDLRNCLVVEILIKPAQHLSCSENFRIIGRFHICEGRVSDMNAT
jgi:hypothetical protein